MVCVCLRMQYYFITQAVDILYGTLCARGLADYGTEGPWRVAIRGATNNNGDVAPDAE